MTLTAEQGFRRELLLFALNKQPDLESAIKMAARMEQYVLKGFEADKPAGLSPAVAGGSNEGRPSDSPQDSGEKVSRKGNSFGGNGRCPPPEGLQKRRWSSADDELLTRRWHSNHALEQIAEELERTTPSLYCRARALGLSKRSAKPHASADPTSEPRSGPAAASLEAIQLPSSDQDKTCAGLGDRGPAPKPPTAVKLAQYGQPQRNGRKALNRARSRLAGSASPSRNGSSATRSLQSEQLDTSIEPVIHFLRSRDYSVVRVEDGRFRLDGRRILTADELREKANQLRRTLGQPPFAQQSAESVG